MNWMKCKWPSLKFKNAETLVSGDIAGGFKGLKKCLVCSDLPGANLKSLCWWPAKRNVNNMVFEECLQRPPPPRNGT